MADESTNAYTLSEVAQIIGVDEKTLHLYAHKGLIDPTLLSDSSTRFTEVDCARLTVIKRANELGYESENIFNLIGSPDEVMNVADPVSACQQFAMKKYKEIFSELSECEPLEQLNKKCDLKLLKNYIMNLEGRKEDSPHRFNQSNITPQPASGNLNRQSQPSTPSAPHSDDVQTPKVLSYSVDKLWDYVKQSDPNQSKEASADETLLDEQPVESQRDDGMGDEILSEMSMQGFRGSPPFDRLMKSRWWPNGDEDYKSILTKPAFRNWIFSLLILALAITGLVKIFGAGDGPPEQQITAGAETPGQPPLQETAPAPDKEQPLTSKTEQAPLTDKEPDTIAQSETTQPPPVTPEPELETIMEGDAAESVADKTAATRTEPEAEPEESQTGDTSEQTVAAVEKPQDTDSTAEVDQPETQAPAPVSVKNLSLWHDSLNKIYRAELTIQKNETVAGQAPIAGYAFVHLSSAKGEEVDDPGGLLMPKGDLESGIPSQIRQGAGFSIKNLIQMRIKAVSELPPNDVSSGKVLVYSSEGILLLEQAFNVPIQPFFTAANEQPSTPPAAANTEAAETEGPTSESIVASETQVAAPEPLTIAATPPAEESIAEESDAPVNTEPEVASASSEPPSPEAPAEVPTVAVKLDPIGNLEKTDNPEAAIWEQKSYDAAVNGNYDDAIADATKAIELDPGRVNPYINRSWSYIEKNMLEHAIRDCKAALQLDPQNMLAYNNRGLAYQRRAELEKAQEDYRKACDLGLELGCQNLDGLINQSRISELIDQSQTAFKAKNWEGVIRATTKVIELDPQNAVAFTNRSAAYAQMSYLVKALKDSNDAIRYNPNFSLAYNNRGYVYELLGNSRKAAADYLKSCSLGLNLGCKNFDKLN